MSGRARKPRIIPRDQYVPYLLGRVSKGSASAASVLYRQSLGIGINNARVVMALARRSGGITATDLSAETGLDKAVVSRSLNVLRAKRLIRFDAARRRRRIELMAAGEALSRRILRMMLDRERLLLKGFSAGEKAALIDYLQRMLVNMPIANAYRPPGARRARRVPK